ncbi:MAG: hypothetical protein JXL97_16930 [Bacteroidales bacterium]|nr:hypothetical protein [Bacteroidales bacterium]
MITTFKLNISELDNDFIDAIRKIFKNQDIELTIKASGNYSQKTLKAKENAEVNENIVEYSVQDFEKMAKELEEK